MVARRTVPLGMGAAAVAVVAGVIDGCGAEVVTRLLETAAAEWMRERDHGRAQGGSDHP
jgi:hypothetical protein